MGRTQSFGLNAHGWEAEECFYLPHRAFRNKRKTGRTFMTFKLEGHSEAGRPILLIFYVKTKKSPGGAAGKTALIRVITG